MNKMSILLLELKLLLKDKLVIISSLTMLGFVLYGLLDTTSTNEVRFYGIKLTSYTTVLSSAKYGAIIGAILFAIITILIISKDYRKNSYSLVEASYSYAQLILIRIAALLTLSVAITVLILLGTWFIQLVFIKTKYVLGVYLFTYIVVMLAPIIFSILMASGLYMLSESIDISFLSFGVIFFSGLAPQNYLLNWVGFSHYMYSDFGGIDSLAKLISYNRLLWLFISLFIFLIGLILRKKYDHSRKETIKLSIKGKPLPKIMITVLLIASIVVYVKEPFIDKYINAESDRETNSQIYLKNVVHDTTINNKSRKIFSVVEYAFENPKGASYIDFVHNPGLQIKEVYVNGNKVKYTGIKEQGTNRKFLLRVAIPQETDIHIKLAYGGGLKHDNPHSLAEYIGKDSIYLLENSNWIYTPLTALVSQLTIKGRIVAPKDLTIVTIGKTDRVSEENDYKVWEYTAKSTQFDLGVFGAKYEVAVLNIEGMKIEFYYSPKHKDYLEKAGIKNYIKDIADFYQKTYGEYAFSNYPLKVVEVPVYKTGGHSTANIITFAEYVGNRGDNFYQDISPGIKNIGFYNDIELLAHEIGHQWWGEGAGIEGKKLWTSEGLTNYAAHQYMKYRFGEVASEMMVQMWEQAVAKKNNSYYLQSPAGFKNISEDMKIRKEQEYRFIGMYYQIPLELLELSKKKGEDEFEKNLARLYKKYKLKQLKYEEFFQKMKIGEGELDLD